MKSIDLSDRTNMFYWQTNRKLSEDETKEIFLNRYRTIDFDEIRKAIEHGLKQAGFSGGNSIIKDLKPIIKHGSVNTVIPVKLESGREVVARIHPKKIRNGYFWVEKVATEHALKHRVPTYSTIIIDDSRKDFPFDFMLVSKEKGRPLSEFTKLDKTLEKNLIFETGKYAALIHEIKPKGFGFFKNNKAKNESALIGQYLSFKDHMYAALDEDVKFLQENKILSKQQGDGVYKIMSSHEMYMECKIPSLIHNDIADWNQLSDGKTITGMMDWDECFGGDPLMEFAAYSLFFGEPRLSWFKEGYNLVGSLEKNEDKFQLFKLRYLLSKMHLRIKRSLIDESPIIKQKVRRGLEALDEVFSFFSLN